MLRKGNPLFATAYKFFSDTSWSSDAVSKAFARSRKTVAVGILESNFS